MCCVRVCIRSSVPSGPLGQAPRPQTALCRFPVSVPICLPSRPGPSPALSGTPRSQVAAVLAPRAAGVLGPLPQCQYIAEPRPLSPPGGRISPRCVRPSTASLLMSVEQLPCRREPCRWTRCGRRYRPGAVAPVSVAARVFMSSGPLVLGAFSGSGPGIMPGLGNPSPSWMRVAEEFARAPGRTARFWSRLFCSSSLFIKPHSPCAGAGCSRCSTRAPP